MPLTSKSFPPKGLLQIRSTARIRSRRNAPKPPPMPFGRVQLTINFRENGYELVFARDSTLADLIEAVRENLHIADEKQKYFVSPNGGMLKSPFADLSLALQTLQDKTIRLIGTTYDEAASLLEAETTLEEERTQLTMADNLEDPFDFVRRIPGLNCDAKSRGDKLWRTLSSVYDEEHLELLVSSGYLAPYLDPGIDRRTRDQLAAGLRLLQETKDVSVFRSHAVNIGVRMPPIDHPSMILAGASQEQGPLPQTWNEYDGHRNLTRNTRPWRLTNRLILDKAVVRASDLEFPADTVILGSMPRVKCVHWPEAHLQGCLSCEDCRAALFLQWSRYIRKHLCYQVTLVVQGKLPYGSSLRHLLGLQERIARLDYETLKGRGFCKQESAVEEELRIMMETLSLDEGEVYELEIHGIDEDDVVSLQAALEELDLEKQLDDQDDEDDEMLDA